MFGNNIGRRARGETGNSQRSRSGLARAMQLGYRHRRVVITPGRTSRCGKFSAPSSAGTFGRLRLSNAALNDRAR